MLTFLCKTSEVQDQGIKQISVNGFDEEFAVYNLNGEYFVTDDMCTHGMVSLSGGDIEDDQIFCPLHGGAFNIRTGEATELPCKERLKIYKVTIKDDSLYAELS